MYTHIYIYIYIYIYNTILVKNTYTISTSLIRLTKHENVRIFRLMLNGV